MTKRHSLFLSSRKAADGKIEVGDLQLCHNLLYFDLIIPGIVMVHRSRCRFELLHVFRGMVFIHPFGAKLIVANDFYYRELLAEQSGQNRAVLVKGGFLTE